MRVIRSIHLVVILLVLGGCSDKKQAAGEPGSFHQPVLEALTAAGLKPASFEKAAAKPYEAKACVRGEVDKLDVLVCSYADDKSAEKLVKKLEQFVSGAVSGAMRQAGSLTLAVADRKKVDLQGTLINKVVQAFEKRGQ